jgi:hypothetical protein
LIALCAITGGFYVICGQIDEVYEATMPADERYALSNLKIVISLGLDGVSSVLACAGLTGYLTRLIFWMITPLVLVGAVVLLTLGSMLLSRRCTLMALVQGATPLIVRLLFLLYPMIAKTGFEAFSCHPAFEDGRQFLIADVSVECFVDDYYAGVWVVAWSAISVYAFGLVALNGALLFCARKAIMQKKPTTLSRTIRFLYIDYKPLVCWWECVEVRRRARCAEAPVTLVC